MTYQAPYSARYVSSSGNQIQLLNLWDDTPEPPRFDGSMEAFETALVDGPRAFAQGLGSAVEERSISFYRWFVDYQDMASYQENLALWLATNQNGYLYLQFADNPEWSFSAVITEYRFETENFIPPPSPENGFLCLLITLTMTLTDRSADSSNWAFAVEPSAVDSPGDGDEFSVSVSSYFSSGSEQIGQGWEVTDIPDGVTVSDIVNGNEGSFVVTVGANESAQRTLVIQITQDGTGLVESVTITQDADTGVFEVDPASLNVPITGGSFTVSVYSTIAGGASTDWEVTDIPDGVTVSDIVNGNEGSFVAAFSYHEGDAEDLEIVLTQEDTAAECVLSVRRIASASQLEEISMGASQETSGSAKEWQFDVGEVFPDFPASDGADQFVTLYGMHFFDEAAYSSAIASTVYLYEVSDSGDETLLATGTLALGSVLIINGGRFAFNGYVFDNSPVISSSSKLKVIPSDDYYNYAISQVVYELTELEESSSSEIIADGGESREGAAIPVELIINHWTTNE